MRQWPAPLGKRSHGSRDDEEETPLFAAVGGRAEVAEVLLDHGAEVDARNKIGVTPLNLAAHLDNKAMAEFPLGRKANIMARDNEGFTALHSAARGTTLKLLSSCEIAGRP